MLVSFGDEISRPLHENVLRLTNALLSENKSFLRNVHPAYATVLISFDPMLASFSAVHRYVESVLKKINSFPLPKRREIEIPVCYGGEFGPDLNDVASCNNLSLDEVVRIHSSGEYLVYFLGFSPGFPYMGGLSNKIATPRLATPRRKTPVGSVAIGGNQTGIYPVSSPGGWRIIGRTPVRIFRRDGEHPTLLQMGDLVRFKSITKDEFDGSKTE